MRFAGLIIALLLAWSPPLLGKAPSPPLLDAVLTGSDGAAVSLARFAGKPMVLFFEDRHSTTLNKPLKMRLKEWGEAHAKMDAARVVAIANLSAFNFFPVKGIALGRVRSMEKKIGIPILADLDGVMTGAPWFLPAESSTVLLCDGQGGVVYQHTGALSDADIGKVLGALQALLGDG